jgi:hypothetical protein
MRLLKSKSSAEEELLILVNEGHKIYQWLHDDYRDKRNSGEYKPEIDNPVYKDRINQWGKAVVQALKSVFPLELEINKFALFESEIAYDVVGVDKHWSKLRKRLLVLIRRLEQIKDTDLGRYTDFPIQTRLFVEDIDSFHKVRDINRAAIQDQLTNNGRFERSEDDVQRALEKILEVPFHKKDWGGEGNDLFTSNVILNGRRISTAYLLKGNGLKRPMMQIRDCGHNGDQLVRLVEPPAELFVVQFIGTISEAVIKDIDGKVSGLRLQGKPAYYLIIDGQDTARLFKAYGLL